MFGVIKGDEIAPLSNKAFSKSGIRNPIAVYAFCNVIAGVGIWPVAQSDLVGKPAAVNAAGAPIAFNLAIALVWAGVLCATSPLSVNSNLYGSVTVPKPLVPLTAISAPEGTYGLDV